jgi:hypothetical protein
MVQDFEFTATSFGNKSFNTDDFKIKAERLVREIIQDVFQNDNEKSKVISRDERLNFACPYCGDSAKDRHKKRGNIYTNAYSFHCYNCLTHVPFEEFLKDFGRSLNGNEIVYIRDLQDKNKQESLQKHYIDNSYFFDESVLEKYAIPKATIFKSYELVDIKSQKSNWIRKYLSDRHQLNFDAFAWDPKYSRLFIFNLTKEDKVLGLQVRNFKSEPKYVTHTIEMLYKHIEQSYEKTPEFLEVNRLSFLFGMCTTDFTRPIIVTEGPLDSFLIPNGMSVCGIDNDFPFEIGNIRWMYDCDTPGMKKAMEKLLRGEYVFLWKKYLRDCGFEIYANKIDYNDVVKFAKINNKNLLSLNDYFSNSKYDAMNL